MGEAGPSYQRYLEPGFTPFDPLALAKRTEEIVCEGDRRKYTKFYCTGVYGGISTGYLCGCCLRCIYCWVNWSRDFPEKYGVLRSPEEVFSELSRVGRKAGVQKLRISGGEPTLGKRHLLSVLELIEAAIVELQLALNTRGYTHMHYARKCLFVVGCRLAAKRPRALEQLTHCPLIQQGTIEFKEVKKYENPGD